MDGSKINKFVPGDGGGMRHGNGGMRLKLADVPAECEICRSCI